MTQTSRRGFGHAGILLFVAVCLVAANLRMTITAVGPLLDEIASDRGVTPATLGLLGSLPLITWGLVSPLAHGVSARLGMSRAVSWALVALAAGTVWRSVPGAEINLWAGTALIGVGLAIANALLPAVIKRDFSAHVPLMMGVYTALLGGTGAIGAGLAVPLSELPLTATATGAAEAGVASGLAGWQLSLLLMGAPIPIALLVWILATRARRSSPAPKSADSLSATTTANDNDYDHSNDHETPGDSNTVALVPLTTGPIVTPPGSAGRRIWGDPLAWQVSLYMGSQSAIFYSLAAWLAPFEISQGRTPIAAGLILMTFQIIGIAGSLALPFIARGPRRKRWLPAALPTLTLFAMLGIVLWPDAIIVWLTIGGLAGGGSLTMALTLMAMRARTSEHATALSGMAQSLGYLIAAIGPFAFGAVLGASGGWIAPFALIWGAAVAQISLGVSVGRPRFVLIDE
ncbi:MFS transporter [Leucobacter sp. W1153]|uniref:MFS transporter n=1 Tax=Leucobacter sp. W1153 TaxID=3439064 RepID=UPI003F3B1076